MPAVRIVTNPKVMMGKPVIEGTRITVELVLEKLAAGETPAQIVGAHPGITEEGVLAALDYAARVLKADIVDPTARAGS